MGFERVKRDSMISRCSSDEEIILECAVIVGMNFHMIGVWG